jgi:hypothetical protein
MKIEEISFRNIASYGGQLQQINFDDTQSDLYLVLGGNGYGKCLSPNTKIEVKIADKKLEAAFKEFIKNKRKP